MPKLLIVESPAKAKSIAKYLGGDWVVKASVGHICDLPQRELGVDPVTYELRYEVNSDKTSVVAGLRAAAKAADEVYLATDPDREGEAIAWHIQRLLHLRSPKRVMFQEITPKECRSAVLSPGSINMNLVHAQEARRCEDRIVGFPVSTALQRKSGRRGLSAGRVQTPGLGLVVNRELEIRRFTSTAHFGVKLTFAEADGKLWTAEWVSKPFLSDGQKYLTDSAIADEVAALRVVRVAKAESKAMPKAPPAPFTTSTLQQAASQRLKINPKRCMQLAQTLFEKGLITYHRTDLPNLREETIEAVREYAKTRGWALPPVGRTWPVKDSAQGAHEAIRSTDFALEDATRHLDGARAATAEEQRLYDLIRMRAIGSQLADAIYDTQTLVLEAEQRVRNKPVHFAARGRTLRKAGFLALTGEDATLEASDDAAASNPVPLLAVGDRREAKSSKRLDKKTEPPQRYTKAMLIKALEEHGVGRPSTYATIVETIEERQYVVEEADRKLRPTLVGEAVYTSLEPIIRVL